MTLIRNPVDRLPIRGRKQWATNLLLSALATEYLGASITVPIMAQYAASFNVDRGLVGLVFSVGSFATLLSDIWLPRVSDSYGRKPAIVLSLLGSSIAYWMETIAPTFTFLLFSTFVGGMFGGTPPVAVAFISDIYSPSERPQYIGLVPAVVSSCFVLGPTIGGFISNSANSFRVPIAVSAIVCGFVALPLVLFFVPDPKYLIQEEEKEEIRELNKEEEQEIRKAGSTKGNIKMEPMDESSILLNTDDQKFTYSGPWRDYRCWICLFISLFNNTVFSCFVTTIPLVLEEPVFGLSSEQDAVYYTGLVLGCGAIIQALGLAFLFNVVQNSIGLTRTVYLGSFISLLGFILISYQTTVFGMAIGFSVFALGNCLTRPGYTSLLTNIVPTEFTARAIAMPTIAASIAGLFSPIVSSELLSKTNHEVLYRCASVVLLLQLILVLSFLRGDEKQEEIVLDGKAAKAKKEEEEAPMARMAEEQFVQELVAVLKHRKYDLDCPRAQKIVMAITLRSFPYLSYTDSDNECGQLLEELKIAQCEETWCKIKRGSIAKRTSCELAASHLTQLGE
mmetsp:Transcript_23766/g.70267  ORF Transcript_23766/g.70267 Transcript_23766/m.70267 type:complete len:564 (-) Transcript_23766:96-1787(-)